MASDGFKWSLVLALLLFFSGCSSYRQSLFLKLPKNTTQRGPTSDLLVPEDQKIKPFDQLTLEVYAANGEALIDPDRALSKVTGNNTTPISPPVYLVDEAGRVKLPLIGEQSVTGLTLRAAEQLLEEKYNSFYKDCFVKVTVANNRITVIANGGLVIPLPDQGMTVLEAIGLAKDITRESKTANIRLLRGSEVILLDLSIVENYPTHNIVVEPGDIIYLEPIRRPFVEGIRDASPFIGIIVSVLTLLILFESLN